MRAPRPFRDSAGFTLVEVMVAIFVLLLGILGTVSLVDASLARSNATKAREAATSLARDLVEAARSLPYTQLTPTSVTSLLQAQPGLGDYGAGAGWTIQRRNFTYTVVASECALDDPSDGVGTHDSTFCSDTAASSSQPADTQPQDYKRVTVSVTWTKPQTAQHVVKLSTLIDNPGNAAGPAVTNLTGPSAITNSATTTASFTATTSVVPAAINWALDGATQTPPPNCSGGTTCPFTWPIGAVTLTTYGSGAVLDGTYTVGAQAFDSGGSSAGARSVTVSLNRVKPLAPVGFAAGWNGSNVDFEWQPNPEGDIIGYRVYRVTGTGNALVWPASASTLDTSTNSAPQDSSPPNQPTIQYEVVALDTDPVTGNPREGTYSAPVTVTQGNQAPNAPTNLVATTAGNSTNLSWTAASPLDPDGTGLGFYRIYRDGTAVGDRYDRTDTGATTTYADTNTGGVPHTYWVAAVDPDLAESTLLGPVTR